MSNSKVDSGETDFKKKGVTKLVETPPSNSTHIHVATLAKRKKTNVVPKFLKIKKVKFSHYADTSAPIQINVPLGTQWHNNSCVYDAIITVLFNVWYDRNPETAAAMEDTQCAEFNALLHSFRTHESREITVVSKNGHIDY